MELIIKTTTARENELESFQVFKKMVYKPHLLHLGILVIGGLVFCVIGLVPLINDFSKRNDSFPMIFLGLALLAAAFFNYRFLRGIIKSTEKLRQEFAFILGKKSQTTEYRINEDGISFTSDVQNFSVSWNLVSSFTENKGFLFLFLRNPAGSINFSTKSLTVEEKKELHQLLLKKVKKI
ncbi:MAG: hypothetical protein ACSHWW_10750 [Nonlabens sp.]|uniref:hypothetical protein n=1 Tax=Nonlabens sp. TaxID=1888209 RepID=UPI003EF8BD4F